MSEIPMMLRRRSGAEWMRHMAGHELRRRERRARQEALWREVEAAIPCG